MDCTERLKQILEVNKSGAWKDSPGTALGVYSVCSAHRTVLEASILQARDDNSLLVIESTSNQVNQFGGYTGMEARDFAAYIKSLADGLGYPFGKILLGGDHLGPNVWQGEKAESAMEKARVLVRSCVKAGYKKIHLDASMFCLDDEGDRTKPLSDEITAERTARLCRACEDEADMDAAGGNAGGRPLYIIGTEVPTPGGSREKEDFIKPTEPGAVRNTLAAMERAFKKYGLENAWERVIALVTQPGVEFGDDNVFYYDRERAGGLSRALDHSPLVYEAHSTDYQTGRGLRQLAEDHFCIQKVGPALSFAYREALFSLAGMEKELSHKISAPSNLEETIEKVMLESRPNYWEKYYRGTEEDRRFARRFSLSDRVRYYWPDRELTNAVERLFGNLSGTGIPLTLVSQYMPHLFMPFSEGTIGKGPRELTIAHIRAVLDHYARACGFKA